MSKMGDFNLQLTEALADNPAYASMTPQEALQATEHPQDVYDTITQPKARQRASQSLREAHLDWEAGVAVSAFLQWAEEKLTQDGAWDNFFTENNTEWETEPDGEPNLVFSGDFENLVESLIEEFEGEYGAVDDKTAEIAIETLTKRLDDAWTMGSEWDNKPDELGRAINQAFDDYYDASMEAIKDLDERDMETQFDNWKGYSCEKKQ